MLEIPINDPPTLWVFNGKRKKKEIVHQVLKAYMHVAHEPFYGYCLFIDCWLKSHDYEAPEKASTEKASSGCSDLKLENCIHPTQTKEIRLSHQSFHHTRVKRTQ